MNNLTLPASRAVIFGCAGLRLTPKERDLFAAASPWGFILFSRNLQAPDQIAALCSDLRDAVGWHAPILIDQEGGRVERMSAPHWHSFPPPLDDAAHPDADRRFWLRGRLIAHDLLSCGINVNCAPVCDVATADTHPFLRNRCYGTTSDQVTSLAQSMIDGQADGGVASVIKHVPGHGRGQVDSHLGLPTVTATREELGQDFAPFRALRDVPIGMTGHMVVAALDPEHPATQSKIVLEFVRNDIGFGGLLMTDDISMEALDGDVVHRSHLALAAGCDLALHCNGNFEEMTALAKELPMMTDVAQRRADLAVKSIPQASDVDMDALRAERAAMDSAGT